MALGSAIDVHQHLWPAPLVDRLRARSQPPYLRDWTLVTTGERPFDVDPLAHDVGRRIQDDLGAGIGLACVSLSAPLGIEHLAGPDAAPLLDAWHTADDDLPPHFAVWASVASREPDLDLLRAQLRGGFVGLQVPATDVSSPVAWEQAGDLLRVAERAGKPVLVHPGPVVGDLVSDGTPEWWAPVVTYATQLQAAWWAWHAVRGRDLFPDLRVIFAAGAGLAPVHHERHAARGGDRHRVDPDLFVDTSSYGPQALDALVRVLGIDALVLGSDAPYAAPVTSLGGDAALAAVRTTNPRRALGPSAPTLQEGRSWRPAS